jgi:hypothetical protein
MARTDEIALFVRESLSRQIPRAEVEAALLSAGWQPEQVGKALSSYSDVAFPVPVPRPTVYVSAGEAFLYLILFTALGMSAHAVVELIFRAIEWVYPDPSAGTYFRQHWEGQIRWAVARAIIAFPVFLFASRAAARAHRSDPTQRASPVRRWLTYVAMFIAACVIIGDFVTLVAYLLSGEATMRFLLKVVTVATVAGVILGYYLGDLKSDERGARGPAVAGPLLVAASGVTIAAIGIGLWLIGPPAEQAARRLDERRVANLEEIAQAVQLYWEREKRLPASLTELAGTLDTRIPAADPGSGAGYEYAVTGERGYELCAAFTYPSEGVTRDRAWTHGAGRQCFAREVREPDGD